MLNPTDTTAAALTLASFGKDLSVAVVGASGGLGSAFVAELEAAPNVRQVFAMSRRSLPTKGSKTIWRSLDLEDECSIAQAAADAKSSIGPLHLVIVSSGLLHDDVQQPEKTWRHLSGAALQHAFAVNATGPALVAKHFLPLLDRDRKAAFAALSARVGSIEDNRLGGWYAYRASKAALNMLIRTLAVELARRNDRAFCVALHPGTVDTALSEPFQASVPEGRLFSPQRAASQLLKVLDGLSPDYSGGLFAWDGQRIPF